MKIGVVGKGGVGKTTVSASLARLLASMDRSVIAVDADPDGNLASALGLSPEKYPEPIAHMRDLIMERTEAKDGGAGLMFKINPKVDDLPEKFAVDADGVRLLSLGTVETGGKGCMCPETALLKSLMTHLLLRVDSDVVLDMEAGLEHMGRASATGADALLAVVEPGMRSVQTANRVIELAADIKIRKVLVVANKIRRAEDVDRLREALGGREFVGVLPYSEKLARGDMDGSSVASAETEYAEALRKMKESLFETLDVKG